MTDIQWILFFGVWMVVMGFLIRRETINSEGWGSDEINKLPAKNIERLQIDKLEPQSLWFGAQPGLFPLLKAEPVNDERRIKIDEKSVSGFIQRILTEYIRCPQQSANTSLPKNKSDRSLPRSEDLTGGGRSNESGRFF